MRIVVESHIEVGNILNTRGLGNSTAARKHLATTVARMSDPYVPMQQGVLKKAIIDAEGRTILYNTPYAHYQYYGEVMRDADGRAYCGRAPKHYTGEALQYHGAPMRGKQWDKRMMADHKDEVIDDLAKFVGGHRV